MVIILCGRLQCRGTVADHDLLLGTYRSGKHYLRVGTELHGDIARCAAVVEEHRSTVGIDNDFFVARQDSNLARPLIEDAEIARVAASRQRHSQNGAHETAHKSCCLGLLHVAPFMDRYPNSRRSVIRCPDGGSLHGST